MVLPLTTMSTMIVAMNPRALMNFLSLRVRSEAAAYPTFPMWEIDQVAQQYEVQFSDKFPLTWGSFVSNGRVAP
jgi:thymidylate synthase (FAD)